ncbi:translation initiation factor IF-2 [Siphonobacter sp. SORGH_AS_1065]|uniref:translation initiation factor IF-2 n=1 Tax=Siphonobacter sp. SORGH_AS_1065 TaxID=3041795 RepID=UPI002784DCB1|nr:translation initiation factor IF-2 [Siphonobacter sp. SORGH_AS_1065]MDQ1085901.1 translation initiation factor IF-2 [Siphonobacter sp. SORGH_AS_1065]
MAEEIQTMRLNVAARKINVGMGTIVDRLSAKGFKIDSNPNTKLTGEQLQVLAKEFSAPDLVKEGPKPSEPAATARPKGDDDLPLYFRQKSEEAAAPAEVKAVEEKTEPAKDESRLQGLKVLGKIDLTTGKPIVPVQEAPKAPVAEAPKVETPKVEPPVAEPVKAAAPVVEAPKAEPVAEKPVAPQPVVTPPVVEAKVEPKVEVPAQPAKPEVKAEPVAEPKPEPTVVATPPVATVVEPAPVAAAPKQEPEIKAQTPQPKEEPSKQPQQANRPADQQKNFQKPRHEQKQEPKPEPKPEVKTETPSATPPELIEAKADRLKGLTVLGKIELPSKNDNRGNNNRDNRGGNSNNEKKKRKRIKPVEQDRNQARSNGNANNANNNEPNNRQNNNQNRQGGNQGNQNSNNQERNQGQDRNHNNTNANNNQSQNNNQGGGNNNNNRNNNNRNNNNRGGNRRDEPSKTEVRDNVKNTMAQMGGGGAKKQNFGADRRRERRQDRARRREEAEQHELEQEKILKVTEFVSASDLASLMDVSINDIIQTCMNMGMFVSINQRLDAEAIAIIADEFGFDVQFISAEEEVESALIEEEDAPESLVPRAPVVTIMGHVDHGKTSLLDYIRKTKVASGEAGGITQHIGSYKVKTNDGREIAFLDTPGHEAFTAMRARGAKLTDVAIIVIAADDSVMPQTREAINHAQNAGVPMVFAFSKVDKPGANTEKIREGLSQMNILVEEWGGRYQTQEISSKSGLGIDELLEKVLLEAELLDLKANPNKRGVGTVVEASLDKGRGYVANILVQNGTMSVGDVMLAGPFFGKVKAMFDDKGQRVKSVGPSTPVQVLGLSGAPTAGDKVNMMETERDAREIANKREQLLREQSLRTRKHITLEEIGRRKAIGNFKELNVIVKGDVDGSVEALSDSLLKLSTAEVNVNIIHKGVGQVTESDVMLASAGDAVVVAFQVRPSLNARRLAEQEQIEIRNYSIIYQAIEDIKKAMEGLLEPEFQEVVTANIDIREVFRISKVGTVAGCYVTEGTVKRNNKIRVIRDFIVIHEGEIQALKRFKDDVAEVKFGYECGLSIKNFNDLEVGDTIECFELQEVKRKL